jgi:glycosyltransferase involved in cell wall biosynthesis
MDQLLKSGERVMVVMPAYNAERTLERTFNELPHDQIAEVILVDDGSRDATIQVAKRLGIRVFKHRRNYGYGANQKTCYTEAMRSGATIVVMVHPDYQYDPTLVPEMVAPIVNGRADVVFGSRMKGTSALKQGMPWWKYVSNKALTWLENRVFGLDLSEYHTGYRAYRRSALERVNYFANSDGFIFDQQIVAQFVEAKQRIAEIAVPVRYFPEASSCSFRSSVRYGLGILGLVARFAIRRQAENRSLAPSYFHARYEPALA